MPIFNALPLLGCVHFEGLPDMPAGTAADPSVYASSKSSFSSSGVWESGNLRISENLEIWGFENREIWTSGT